MGSDQKNFLAVLALCAGVFFGGNYLVDKWRGPQVSSSEIQNTPATQPSESTSTDFAASEASLPDLPREEALKAHPRITIDTPKLRGSINLKGAQFDDLYLRTYRETTDPKSPEILLLSPQQTSKSYRVFHSWMSRTRQAISLPGEDTVWTADRQTLTPQTPVTLSWDNGQALTFRQTISIDENYMFTVTHSVINKGSSPLHLGLQGMLTRVKPQNLEGNFILYEGPLGAFDGTLKEVGYDTLQEKGPVTLDPITGWLGITDKYWLVSFAPPGKIVPKFQSIAGDKPQVQVSYRTPFQVVEPHGTLTLESRVFSGAKVLALLDGYEASASIKHFDLAVDFGWFYFLTKPIFYALTWLKGFTGNFGLAILLFTVLLKLLFFPLANRSYHAMARMKKVQPMMEQLRARYKDDPAKLNQEMMAFYKKEKINPVSGCLPMLLQIPAFFALYKVLFISIEMRHAPFFGWIQDLAAPDPSNFFTLFGLISWTPPSFLHLGIWPVLMGLSMVLQQRLNPPPADPAQRVMFLYVMPVVFTFMLGQFASGLVIYWTWNNLLSVLQQWTIMRRDLSSSQK